VINSTISDPDFVGATPAVTRVPMSLGGTSGVCSRAEIGMTLAAIDALAVEWRALEPQPHGQQAAQTFIGWRLLVQSQLAAGLAPRIITIWSGSCLQAVWLLQLQPARGYRLLVQLGTDGRLIAPVFRADTDRPVLARHLIAVARSIGADGLLLRQILPGSALAAALPPVSSNPMRANHAAARDHAIPFTWRGRLVLAGWR
jgi:hypothetical protein